jgi:hypothetical protein
MIREYADENLEGTQKKQSWSKWLLGVAIDGPAEIQTEYKS